MLHRIGYLVVKELLAVLRDPRSRAVLIGPPIVQLLIFAYAATLEVKNANVGLLVRDGGRAAAELVQRIEGSPTFTRVVALSSEAEMTEALDAQRVIVAVHVGEDFTSRLLAGDAATVQVLLDGRSSNAAQIVQGYVAQVVNGLSMDLANARGLRGPPAIIVSRSWFNPNLEYLWFTVPGLVAILSMLIALMVTALSVARERELGTFDQLLVSPLSAVEIVVGKSVPAVLIGLGEGSFMLAMAVLHFGVPFTGSLGLLYLALVVFLLAIVGVGLFVSSLSQTQQQAILGAFVFVVPAVLLSGYAAPIENMPDLLQAVTFLNPLRHMFAIVKGIMLKDLPAADVLASVWPMAVIALATLSGSAWLFRRRLD